MKDDFFKFAAAVILCGTAGFAGAIVMMVSDWQGWYVALPKSSLNPPAFVFGLVWFALYFLMGVSLWLVWRKAAAPLAARRRAFGIFFVQIGLNILWPVIFFGWRYIGVAFAELVILLLSIIFTMIMFFRVSRLAAWLLLPYLIWIAFAGYLNCSIWVNASGAVAFSPAQAGQSGIVGAVLIGPSCPVERVPPEPRCAPKPYQTRIAVFRQTDRTYAVAFFKSDADGRFEISLPPDNYLLAAGESALPRCGSVSVTVLPNQYASTTIFCDTGIR
ncbi:tryptophan-rich sensory protein [Patescibacteria group bacterium]|nr:tryptophan-rich sensory protein [Patescibacteria group bacterium]